MNYSFDGTTCSVEIVTRNSGTFALSGLKNVSFSNNIERSKVKGVGSRYTGYTRGIENPDDATLEMLLGDLNLWLSNVGEDEMLYEGFDVIVNYQIPDGPLKTYVLQNCLVNSYAQTTDTEATDALIGTVTFSVLRVKG